MFTQSVNMQSSAMIREFCLPAQKHGRHLEKPNRRTSRLVQTIGELHLQASRLACIQLTLNRETSRFFHNNAGVLKLAGGGIFVLPPLLILESPGHEE